MAGEEARTEIQIIEGAFEDRVRDLFKLFAETVYTGEPEREAIIRFKRGLLSARRARDAAVAATKEE